MEKFKIDKIRFSRNWLKAIKIAPTKEQQNELIFAVLDYAFDGADAIKDASQNAKAFISLIAPEIDKQKAKIFAGSQGRKGAPKGNQNARKYKKGAE